jgi:hypothetical protein
MPALQIVKKAFLIIMVKLEAKSINNYLISVDLTIIILKDFAFLFYSPLEMGLRWKGVISRVPNKRRLNTPLRPAKEGIRTWPRFCPLSKNLFVQKSFIPKSQKAISFSPKQPFRYYPGR